MMKHMKTRNKKLDKLYKLSNMENTLIRPKKKVLETAESQIFDEEKHLDGFKNENYENLNFPSDRPRLHLANDEL